MAGVNPNAYVGFLTGTQQSVDNMLAAGSSAGAIEGAFYLTNDTHRLYIGNSDTSLSPVNQGVRVIADASSLPELSVASVQKANVGQFYYLSNSNILCIASGDSWVQINPDHTLLHQNGTNVTVTTAVDSNSKRYATITNKVQETTNGRDPTANFSSGDFKIKSGENVWITVNPTSREITLEGKDGAKYSLTAAKNNTTNNVELTLTNLNDNTDVYKVPLAEGDCGVRPRWDAVNQCIALDGGGLVNGSISVSENNGAVTLTVTDGINPISKTITPTINVGTGNNVTPITSTYDSTNSTLTFDLNVYTTQEVDNLLNSSFQNFEAMYMAGLLGTGGTVTSWTSLGNQTGLRNGATFKVCSEMELDQSFRTTFGNANVAGIDATGDATLEVGDLVIISTSSTYINSSTGFIDMATARSTSNALKIYIIPSGDDQDVYYTPDLSQDNKVVMTRSFNDGISANSHTLQFAAGTNITLSNDHTQSTSTASKNVLTVSHNSITTTPTTGTAVVQDYQDDPTYTAITGLTISNGHVTGYTTQQLTLWTNDIYRIATTATPSTSSGTKLVTIARNYQTEKQGSLVQGGTNNNNNLVLKSNSLDITTPGGTASGVANGSTNTAAEVEINMRWGSFASS